MAAKPNSEANGVDPRSESDWASLRPTLRTAPELVHSSLQQVRPPVPTDQSEDSNRINVKHEGYLMRFGLEQPSISLRNTYCRSSSDTQP